jgi:hypothetical protein
MTRRSPKTEVRANACTSVFGNSFNFCEVLIILSLWPLLGELLCLCEQIVCILYDPF